MKRFISIFFTLCLVVALSLSASAESTNKLTYAVGASAPTVSANTEFQILVDITENTGVCWLKTKIVFDASVLTFVGANTDTSVFKTATLTVNSSTSGNEGKVIVVMGSFDVLTAANPPVYSNTGRYVTLTFKVNPDAKDGTTPIYVLTAQGDAIYRKNGTNATKYELNFPTVNVNIGENTHTTCTPGAAQKQNEVPATCTAVGSYDEVVKCTECGKVLSTTKVIISPNEDHLPGTAVKENEVVGDCKTAATYDSVVYCTRCLKEISRTKVTGEKGDHVSGVPEVLVTDSTCVTQGSLVEVYKCKVCGVQIDKKTTPLELVDHTPAAAVKENVVNSTCSVAGSYDSVIYCSVCNAKISSQKAETPKLNHTPGASVKENEVAATCFAGGYYDLVVKCSVCNAEISRETKSVAKLEHIRGSAKIENRREPVNCGANGSYDSVIYCTLCNTELDRVSQVIQAPDHKPGAAATETTPQICSVCNIILAPALGHQHKWATAWTTDNAGHWHACSGCSEKKDYETHHYANSCDSDCNICGYYRSGTTHSYDNDCDTDCNKCGEKRVVVGHVYDNDCDTTCNSCNAIRTTTHKYDNACDADCNVCGAKRTPSDHVFGSWTVVQEATEKAEGKREHTCLICGFTESEKIPVLAHVHSYDNACDADCNGCGVQRTPADHVYGNWVTTTEPTATVHGQRERSCNVCGKKVTESIPATGSPETTPPETTKETETTKEPETTEAPATSAPVTTDEVTVAPEATDPEQTTDSAIEDPGCGSAVSMGIALIAILGTALIMKKRD